MKNKINISCPLGKKRILIALLPLLAFNLILIVSLVFFKGGAWSQEHDPYEWGRNERLYTAEKTQEIKSEDGETLFRYEGADANCWEMEKEWQVQECLKEHPYGGQGTMTIGGNLVIDNAQALYINGYDRSGYNWIMTGTEEPYGNAIGTKQSERANVMYGNNLVVDGGLETGSVNFASGGSSISFDQEACYMVADGQYEMAKKMTLNREEEEANTQALQIIDQGVCGYCRGTCSGGQAGQGYQFIADYGLDVKEMTKVNAQMRFCGETEHCEDACCRLLKYLDDDIEDDFVGSDCYVGSCADEEPIQTRFVTGVYRHGISGNASYCYPQEYPHNPGWVKPDKTATEYELVHMDRAPAGDQDHLFHQ